MNPRNCGYCDSCARDDFDACTTFPKKRGLSDALSVDCIGLALVLESSAKRVESKEARRAMLAAANGLRIMSVCA